MDRPLFKKKVIFLKLLFLLSSALLQTAHAAEKSNKIKKSLKKKESKPPVIAIEGIFPGVVKAIDPEQRYFEATPTIPDTERIFYIDQKTIIKKNWKEVSINELAAKDKVKVVYLKKDKTFLANIVYVQK